MAEPGGKSGAGTHAQQKAERRRRVIDMLEPRLITLLLLSPPTLGIILGGVAVTAYRRLSGQVPPSIPGDYVTLGLGIFGLSCLALILFLASRAYRGLPTRFPRLWRIAPFAALGGVVLGLLLAWLKAIGRIA